MFSSERGTLRDVFYRAWAKHSRGEALEGVETLVVQIARQHPEYHSLLDDPDNSRERDYLPDSGDPNPFLHMAMHIAIEEQITTDQPRGIREHYRRLLARHPDPHTVQHRMMDCLGETVWQTTRGGQAPDEAGYLACLERLSVGPGR
ncbi:MAG: DUF1841 family protein [Pseudomonadota bacterium]